MYVDCKICGYESCTLLLLGAEYDKVATEIIEKDGGSMVRNTKGDWEIECPNGHDADLLPTVVKFWKRYKPPLLKNDNPPPL